MDGRRSGGTGVHVKLPSGKVAILTNAHVCEAKNANNEVLVHSPQRPRPIPRKVLEQADFTDLCLVEGIPGVSGISLGSQTSPGDIVAVIGHPHLMPITMSRGEVIGEAPALVLDHVMREDEDDSQCALPKNKILTIDAFFFKIKVCAVEIPAIYTTVVILPGNSGSAVINEFGNLVGLAFAGDNDSHWGLMVTLPDIKKFISAY